MVRQATHLPHVREPKGTEKLVNVVIEGDAFVRAASSLIPEESSPNPFLEDGQGLLGDRSRRSDPGVIERVFQLTDPFC